VNKDYKIYLNDIKITKSQNEVKFLNKEEKSIRLSHISMGIIPLTNDSESIIKKPTVRTKLEESFSLLIKGKRVIFVGPATTLEGKKMGEYIDSFDTVIRMNSSMIIPPEFQEDYGSRCDILYVSSVFHKNNLLTIKNTNHIKLICSTRNYSEFSSKNHLFDVSNIYNDKKLLTGLYVIQDILNGNPSELYITGIDFYQSEINYVNFYKIGDLHTDENVKRTINKYHDVDHDLTFFKENIANKSNVTLDETLRIIVKESVKDRNVYEHDLFLNPNQLNTNKREGACMFISLTSDFIIGYRVFIQSFLKHNQWFNHDIIIMSFNLTRDEIDYIKSFYTKIKFIKPNYEKYKRIDTSSLKFDKFLYNYYKLDIFMYTEYEKIVSIDCDMLVQGDVSDLFTNNYRFGAVPIFSHNKSRMNEFNGGLIVLDSGINNQMNYMKVLEKTSEANQFAEQDVLNKVFGSYYTRINKTYNAEKRMLKSNNSDDVNILNNAKIIHYVGGKPWELRKKSYDMGYEEIEQKWKSYNKRKVIIIGNSPIVLDKKMKNIIDSFDIIIRINDFEIDNYEEFVGTKTTHAFCTFATIFNKEYKKLKRNIIYMFTAERYGDHEFLEDRVSEFNTSEINILSNYYLFQLNDIIGIKLPLRPSTGLIAVEFALQELKDSDIYIYGIETEYKTEFTKTHYFNKDMVPNKWKESVSKYHDFKKEKEYINLLIKTKKINIL
jgi:lipopolysaccharide biosynthesis glycosyltransferase